MVRLQKWVEIIDMYLFELISPKVTEDVSVSYNYDINGTVVTEEQPHVTIQNENIEPENYK